jgi:hypothetical protein
MIERIDLSKVFLDLLGFIAGFGITYFLIQLF